MTSTNALEIVPTLSAMLLAIVCVSTYVKYTSPPDDSSGPHSLEYFHPEYSQKKR